MKKFVIALVLVVGFLALFIPFASSDPDGLQRVASSMGISDGGGFWRGLIGDYAVGFFKDSYVSSLVAGVLGVLVVLGASLGLGLVIARRAGSGEKSE